jgi:hypothetical protein
MVNVDPRWIMIQQHLQNATDGQEVKDALLICLDRLLESHNENVLRHNTKYIGIIDWLPENPDGTLNPPPDGWELDGDTWVNTLAPNSNGGENNGG